MASDSIGTIPVDGGRIAYHRRGSGRPLLALNGLAATSADWDPLFIERLASANELISSTTAALALPRITAHHSISTCSPPMLRE